MIGKGRENSPGAPYFGNGKLVMMAFILSYSLIRNGATAMKSLRRFVTFTLNIYFPYRKYIITRNKSF